MFEALLLAARRTPRRPRRATPAGADAGVDSGVSTASLADSADADAKSDVVADAAAERKGGSRAREEGEGEEEEEKKDEVPPTPAGSPPARLRRMLLYFRQPGRSSLPRDASSAAWHCGPAPQTDMVSRRRILSRSRDDLNLDSTYVMQEEEEDVWYQRDKLYKDHIQEVLDKWTQIDDEIWAKVIVLERNRRVAKAYARAPVLTVNGSDDGFDGFRIGLCGFDNPMRDAKTDEIKRHIGHGVKVKMDDQGNILVKRVSKSNVYVKSTAAGPGDETSIGNEILKMPGCALEMDKPVKLFDMKKFQQNVSRELRRAYPDRRRLECQCLSAVAFVKAESELLDCPIWVLIINVVAMDMLKSRLPPVKRAPLDIRNRPRIPVPDEDPYSVAGSGGSGGSGSSGASSGGAGGVVAAAREQLLQQREALLARGRADRPPKLPPRDPSYPQPQPHDIPKPDYDDVDEEVTQKSSFPNSRGGGKNKDGKKYDDPYYCGLRARVPNFAKAKEARGAKEGGGAAVGVARDGGGGALGQRYPAAAVAAAVAAPPPTVAAAFTYAPLPLHPHAAHPPHGGAAMWHARSFDSGMDSEALDSPYNHIYGRLPIPTRSYIPPAPRTMYIGEWD